MFKSLATKRTRINNQITATPVRAIGDDGTNYGIIEIAKAIDIAKEAGLDVIEISPTARPPVVKIMDYGKWSYQEEKKRREANKKARTSEVREVRIGLNTSEHDLEMKAKKVGEFLDSGDKVKIDLVLRGRAKYLDKNFKNERIERILHFIPRDYKVSDGPKQGPRGIYVLVEKK
ncbi:translation initiation factor IF-3 [Candidatus Giovannonibacteria bacterium RIFCSPHIGHO2_12_44_12]|uniref:Translation initiation factor IF-3 n=4 Tax=Candidatus Giovannoniibacteriota TaxID=1752738 RepID=A0A1F5WZV9_9BACT|nr:MAG: translation initiation factor IF-3 [Alicyclobacillus sp. RIFOXYA1_FULL_53_8]OGF73449.1 MAG: translation initiation factor IF-3 [Candidatus Giovannonibacteria bacterium RIFCSPHIGHO2_02_43_16]OGF81174.1 MAG: translation initiation factor IF-3 [Candidatus Giovannonibacteria bacterium RIFCSPHIGHO2_12_44_12]OGF86083.1 MAG: translation initiation factor IF-3 [Candidatus Giovannonibacteria bacterium RIFCSPLOWO2_02_44_8]OGF95625.1 MAG: translation initiation factor IF-3 [Candidatus Giovannoniba